MIADIQPPNLETRIAILQAKAASLGQRVPDDVLTLIAQRAHKNIRDLEGALTKVLAHAELFKRPLNAALVDDALAYLAPAAEQAQPGSDPGSRCRLLRHPGGRADRARPQAPLALQRQIIMYVMREETGASLPQIGQVLGGRDHSTIIHGVDRVASELDNDADLNRAVTELRNRLYEPMRVRTDRRRSSG